MQSKLAIVIMAAGKGTRLKTTLPKVLHKIGGKPLLAHVISTASRIVPPDQIFVVIGHQAELVKAAVEPTGVHFIEQADQRGTGHAIQCAQSAVAGYDHILVLSGDVPLIRPEAIEQLLELHLTQKAAMTILTAVPQDPFGYGRILRPTPNSPEIEAIVEQRQLAPAQQSLSEINSGIYAFSTAPLFAHLGKLTTANPYQELILPEMASQLRRAGERVVAVNLATAAHAAEVLGANTIAELVALDATLRAAAATRLMAAGVTIYRPETSIIDSDVEVAPDTVIEPFVQLLGSTRIGSGCLIRSYSVIENCTLGHCVEIRQSSVLEDSTVADGATIGPFAHLRPGSEIGQNVHIGNFVETKKAKLHKGVKAGHLTYIGDAEVGEETNIGAGVITCNYDGVHKNRTHIGSNVFVGSDSTLVAPITVEDGAYIGAGSCITKDVPADSLALGRSPQIVKQGWATARRARQKNQTQKNQQ